MAQTKAQLLNPLNGSINVSGIVTSGGFKVGTGISIVGSGIAATAFYGDGSNLTNVVNSVIAGDNISVSGSTGNVTITGLANTSNVIADTVSTGTLNVTGISTFTGQLSGAGASFTGNVSVGGTLTYEDVTNVDSIGVITARSGIKFGSAGVGGTITSEGHAEFVGVVTAQGFVEAQSGIKFGVAGAGGTVTADGHAEFVGVVTASEFDGRVPNIPQNAQGGAYTLVKSDAGKHINAGGNVTVNASIFDIGDAISVFNDTGGDITIIQGTSVTLRLVADTSTGTRTLANYGLACILCVGSNEFVVSGGGIS